MEWQDKCYLFSLTYPIHLVKSGRRIFAGTLERGWGVGAGLGWCFEVCLCIYHFVAVEWWLRAWLCEYHFARIAVCHLCTWEKTLGE